MTRPPLVLRPLGRWARADAGQAVNQDRPQAWDRRLARVVLVDQHVALGGQNVISVMQG